MNMCKCGHARSSHVYTTCHCTVCACPNYEPVEEEVAAPLPPTAEQTSIARFNALANEIRELRDIVTKPLTMELEIKATLIRLERRFEAMENIVITELIALKRAVAKKKAAPLVGKKGTGRKG